MTAIELLSYLRGQDVRLWVEGDRLRYNAAKGLLTRSLLSELVRHKAEILALLRETESTCLTRRQAIRPQPRDGRVPLSFAQQRLWFLDQLVPGSASYNIASIHRFELALDVKGMERALNEIVRRHEALRTTFVPVDGQPAQLIASERRQALPLIDLRSLSASERQSQALRLATEEARQPFDLSRGPLVRTTLLQLAREEYLFLLTMHHIVSDGWSMEVFFRELSLLYGAFVRGETSPLEPLPIQYADFALWQRGWLEGRELQRQLSYWERQLADLPLLQLPTDRARPVIATLRGERHPMTLPAELAGSLRKLSQQEGVTLFMTLLAGFAVLLHRYTGQEDVVIGAPIANRNRAEIEGLIGFFVNSLVLRLDLSGEPTFRQLLGRVREVALEGYAHQDLPFEKLVKELHPDRDLSRNPLFQITFQLQHDAAAPERKTPEQPASLEVTRGTAIFDLAFRLWDTGKAIEGGFEYSTDLFEAATIGRLASHLEILLQGIAADPDKGIAEFGLFAEADRRQLVIWNETGWEYPPDSLLHRPFEARAAERPQATAVVWEDGHLTYQSLNHQANQLARYLRRLEVRPDTLIAVCLDRSPTMVIALLGILKAGGAYVPMDPSYPRERLAFMLKDSQASMLLTRRRVLGSLPLGNTRVVCLDTDWETISQERLDNLDDAAVPDHLAYLLYTSGSLGQPKGVMISHRAICNHMFWMREQFPLALGDRVLQKTPVSFDASVWEFYAPLWAGAQLVLARPDGHRDSAYLVGIINREAVTILQVVPTLLQMLLEEPGFSSCRSLRHVFCGGEALTSELQTRFFATLPAQLHNLYGPTEATIDATFWTCRNGDGLPAVPIGRPIANVQAHVLDPKLRPTPVGIPGELCLGGAGLARGYLNRPDLTAEKFIADPLDGAPGARLFRTGDRVRFRQDGVLEFLGRLDRQIKLRGHRIELEEIESVLGKHPGVSATAVALRGDKAASRRLVAYVVQNPQYRDDRGGETGEAWEEEQVAQWQTVHDAIYQRAPTTGDPAFNTVGWNSSYTGQPLGQDEMREWLEETVKRIVGLGPSRVLEIGCGAGLLMLQIAPQCEAYWGTDFSSSALVYAQEQANRLGLSRVRLLACRADDCAPLAGETFDTVILNSVVQYFPGVDYLVRVIEDAARMVRPGGSIFVGDVRSLPLLSAFHTSLELFRADPAMPLDELRQRVRNQAAREQELVLDPTFFWALRDRIKEIGAVDLYLKPGKHRNELNQFRYDVMLTIGPSLEPEPLGETWDWVSEGLNLENLRERLIDRMPTLLRVTGIPNRRVEAAVRAAEWLKDGAAPATAGELRKLLQEEERGAIEPADLEACGLPYDMELRWPGPRPDGSFDAWFRRGSSTARDRKWTVPDPAPGSALSKPWSAYANNPNRFTRQLVPALQKHLRDGLPEYMVPSTFLLLEALPLLTNGKVNRAALPVPDLDLGRSESARTLVPPRNATEAMLVQIWTELLGLEQIGVEDHFFTELGGHSLLATQLISRVRARCQVELSLRTIFESPTVGGLALAIVQKRSEQSNQEELARILAELEAIPEETGRPLPAEPEPSKRSFHG